MIKFFIRIFFPVLGVIYLSSCYNASRPVIRNGVSRGQTVPVVRVLISESDFLRIRLEGDFLLLAPEARYKIGEKQSEFWASLKEGGWAFISDNRKYYFRSGFPIRLVPRNAESKIIMDGKELYGTLSVFCSKENGIKYVLETDLESYLLGVIPAEIPTGNEQYFQAVCAQTIAARTYAYKKLRKNGMQLFDLFDDQRDQVLGSMSKANTLVKKAVRNTRGVILTANDNGFIPYYHSTCGGMFIPYTAKGYVEVAYDAPHPDSIAYCSISPLYRWHKKISAMQLTDALRRKGLVNTDSDSNGHELIINIGDRDTVTGRVQEISIDIDGNSVQLSNYAIRKTITDSSGKALPSNWFFMAPSVSDTLDFLLVGAGFGHGKGMCQWGAIAMSLKGFAYDKILNHYYPGAYLRRIYR